ncbi:MAG: recombinase RecT [Halopseudomonas aestusnigri]|nr:recombinase RecT [Halopseudomonas aestusnigri]
MEPQKFQQAVALIKQTEDKFVSLVEENTSGVHFKSEMLFASQVMMNNDYLLSTASRNPLSLRSAFHQVAVCGLTLNPSRGLSYLVPRDNQVVLEISYRGMIRMAVDDGAIKDCIVELVYSKDNFTYHGKRTSPEHSFDPFAPKAERGEFRGVYVEALLPDGRLHIEVVTAEDIYTARDASDLWKRKKKGPWLDHFGSMAKKAAIKVARKYWPQGSRRLDDAIQYLNDNGEGFKNDEVPVEVVERYMGEAEVVDQPLEGTLEQAMPAEQHQQEKPEAEVVETQASPAETTSPQQAPSESELPPKVIKKVAEIVRRAQDQGCWQAALDHIQSWPAEAMAYAKAQLTAAQYAVAASGE